MKRIIIHGLRPEYNGFIAAVRRWPTQPTLVELENLLANQEALAKQMGSITLKENDEVEALFIRKKGPLRGRGETKQWTRGGRRCPKKSSYSEGAQQESEDEDQQDLMERRRKRGKCFNCGKKGHLARVCESLRKHSGRKCSYYQGYGKDEVEEEEEEWDMEEGFSIEVAETKMLELEASRDLSKIWLHTDMDAFYSAVETLENPSLKGKPLAVGSMSMIATASYEARKFGVRAAMPGFIGRKLCPGLVFVPPKFERYTHYSELTRRYDPNFIATSLDEAYLNITNTCIERGITGEEVADELRAAIHQETGLTCSAGVAPNRMIAKVCSDINKPNGQFILPNDREAVLTFVSTLPIRKLSPKMLETSHSHFLRLYQLISRLRMSQLYDEKDNSSTSTQKTLDIFFRSSHNNSNANGINGQDSSIDLTTRDECLEHDAGTYGSLDQQAFLAHDESLFRPEQRSSVDYSSEDLLSSRLICDGVGGTKSDDVKSSEKVTPSDQVNEVVPLTRRGVAASSSKPSQHFWIDGYICSLCGFELPLGFEEERQEHSDFHLAEMLQQEEAVDSTRRTCNARLVERPCPATPTPKKKQKSSKDGKHIPIEAFFRKSEPPT
ncbi:hypothetical protein PR202_gb11779 [Eleusine coracana subsp. coracana]|uniref:DNA polymerase kappa n=1 Tax=Eleusine coracana subsp. coracana TaxID=191504 RepID=A0AAV5ENE0_ELECO|nr:hypothetical protein PR202_gb11779 [Eleusine coracana subsp. coracana]